MPSASFAAYDMSFTREIVLLAVTTSFHINFSYPTITMTLATDGFEIKVINNNSIKI